MFEELTEELLDLSVNVRGYGSALYAAVDDDPGSSNCCSLCSTFVLCCCYICW